MPTEILFENNLGKIELAGGLNPLLSPIEISGLFIPEKEIIAAVFKTMAGQKLISSRDKPRIIKITGMLEGDLPSAARLLHISGSLTFKTERMSRVIGARCTDITNYTNNNRLVLTFMCDNPYFHDGTDLKVTVYSRIEQISTPFTLPAVFTKRVRKGNCKNESTVVSEPEIIIRNMGKNTANGFTVLNENTSAKITVNCEIPPGGRVFMNIANRSIVSDEGENLLPALADNCYLHEFCLAPGDNFLTLDAEDGIECEVIYNTNYTEAVI